jgi:hypothetical protein
MTTEDQRATARAALNDAIGNGQIHPALADYLATVDDALDGVRDRHDALVADLNADKSPAEEPADEPADDSSPSPAKVAAAKTTQRGR